jgi:hypothetical protein
MRRFPDDTCRAGPPQLRQDACGCSRSLDPLAQAEFHRWNQSSRTGTGPRATCPLPGLNGTALARSQACCGRTAPTRTDPGTNTPMRSLGPRIVPPSIHPLRPRRFPPWRRGHSRPLAALRLRSDIARIWSLMRFAMICGLPTTSAVSSWLIAGGVTCGLA